MYHEDEFMDANVGAETTIAISALTVSRLKKLEMILLSHEF